MSNRYAPLPNPRSNHDAHQEMEAAFDDSEDEDDQHHNISESRPLNPTSTSPSTDVPSAHIPGTYDFESVDYDYPPPGSPPRPSAIALPNDHGNSNGLIPSFSLDSSAPIPRRGWFKRTAAALLPSHYIQRFGLGPQRPSGAVGGGTNNDGVFANVTAKPTRPMQIQDGDDTYIVPEDVRADAPPSYASAQADSVPPYWETTVHAPFSPDSIGEMIIDSLPTGSLFSFLWNMLVSISFQFVGFLLTYLLHTTHAARLGSRAGLGVTLIQYGFALRGRLEGAATDGDNGGWSEWSPGAPRPSSGNAAQADGYNNHGGNNNSTIPSPTTGFTDEQANILAADVTTEWLSFFLMTIGWFMLLTSLLGFWRVKRWERGILSSQRENNTITPGQQARDVTVVSQFERAFGLSGISRGELFRQGFGLGRNRVHDEDEEVNRVARAEEGDGSGETDVMLPMDPNDPDRNRALLDALARDRRLQHDLRAAGLL
jgi:hypothetical protein